MKKIGVTLILLGLFSIPSYSEAEISAPTIVIASEGSWSDLIRVEWELIPDATRYEIWRDSYTWCEGPYPCERKFILWSWRNENKQGYNDSEDIMPYGEVFEYRIKACTGDGINEEYICSDFSLPAYGYVLEDAPRFPTIAFGGGYGIFGDIIRSSVIGYHLDGFTTQGTQIYMPVTPGFKALKGAQEYIRSFAPNLAVMIREGFDYLEQQADADKEGVLYNIGTYIFPVLGELAEKILKVIGEEKFIAAAYSDTTISVEAFKKLERRGQAIAPKVLKDREILQQEKIFTYLVN